MRRILAVAINTFREAVRDKVLYGMLGVALVVLVLTLAAAEVSLDQQRRIVLDVGLASISIFSVVVAVFLGSSLLYKEIERKTLYVILPKPIHRYEFLLGKYFGIVLTAFVFIMIMGAVQLNVTSVQAGANPGLIAGTVLGLLAILGVTVWKAKDRTASIVPWSMLALGVSAAVSQTVDVNLPPIMFALSLTIEEVLMLTSVAMLFSSFSTPFLTALFTLGVWITGRSADTMATIKGSAIPETVKEGLKQLALVWPNFNLFVPGRHTLEQPIDAVAGPVSYMLTTTAYTLLYSFVLLTIASLIFQRRDFL